MGIENDVNTNTSNLFSNLFVSGPKLEDIVTKLNQESAVLLDWLHANRLSLNLGKTHYMIFSPKPREVIPDQIVLMGSTPISRVYECKFLGIIIDSKLTWKPHIQYIATKVAKATGILNKARRYFSRKTLITLY